ncbi:MAG: ATPase [Methanobrevibacter sp.]|jgi:predicted PP-loop superfamily ATPase|nr:ATPase [Candidatus Methanovirga meridionalis]
MKYSKNLLISEINRIRNEIGHDEVKIFIKDIFFDEKTDTIWIVTKDRGSKSGIIGKGGWVVGRLKEDLNIKKIHVESHSDFILKEYQMKLSLSKLNSFIEMKNKKLVKLNDDKINDVVRKESLTGILNLRELLKSKTNQTYKFNLENYLNKKIFSHTDEKNQLNDDKHQAVIALSGGVDSSFSLILAKYLGFNPIAITVDPGTIILPKIFKNNINNLTKKLNVEHYYLKRDYKSIIEDSLNGRFHPCGRCSAMTGKNIFEFAYKKGIDIVIFGDLLSTGCQCLTTNKIRFSDEINTNKNSITNENNNEINNNKINNNKINNNKINNNKINNNKINNNKINNNKINNNKINNNEINNNEIKTSDKENEITMFRLNLPATLSIGKEEIREFVSKFDIKKIKGFGCPLLHEAHKKYPHIKKFSIQRILRETRSGALEPGEAIEQIWSFYKT